MQSVDVLKPVMFKKVGDLSPYWMQIEISEVNSIISITQWQVLPGSRTPHLRPSSFTPDEGEGEDWSRWY